MSRTEILNNLLIIHSTTGKQSIYFDTNQCDQCTNGCSTLCHLTKSSKKIDNICVTSFSIYHPNLTIFTKNLLGTLQTRFIRSVCYND